MRVRPRRVLAGGRTRRIGEGLLADEQEGAIGQAMVAVGDRLHGLLLAAGDVDGPGDTRLGGLHGIGPSRAQSTFTVASPYRYRRRSER